MSIDIRDRGYFKIMPCGRLNTINYCEKCPNKYSCEHLTRKEPFNFGDHITFRGKKVTLKDLHHKFKFKCAKCGVCCSSGMHIRLKPYDLLRLSHRLQISVKDFSKKYTYYIVDKEQSFTISCLLKTRPACAFWTQKGCSVYEDRPLACRSYPIGIYFGQNKNAYFITPKKCPGMKHGKRIKIKEFLEKSEVLDYIEMSWLFQRFRAILKRTNFPKNEKRFNTLFIKILYEFDEPEVKQLIKNVTGKENTDDKQTIRNVMETAEKIILKPLLSKPKIIEQASLNENLEYD